MAIDVRETGYDKIQLANGTRAEIVAGIDKINTHEPIIVTDEDRVVYKDASGNLKDISMASEDELRRLIEQNKNDILLKLDASRVSTTLGSGFDWSNQPIPKIETSGVMEIGKYIDFHETSKETDDFKVRLSSNSGRLHIAETSGYSGNILGDIYKERIGWCKFANGLIIQWGTFVKNTVGGVTRIPFPISFSNNDFYINFIDIKSGVSTESSVLKYQGYSTTYAEVIHTVEQVATNWIAIGY